MSSFPPLPPLPPLPSRQGNSAPVNPLGENKKFPLSPPVLVKQEELNSVLPVVDIPFAPQQNFQPNQQDASGVQQELTLNKNMASRWLKGVGLSTIGVAIVAPIITILKNGDPVLITIISLVTCVLIGAIGFPIVSKFLKPVTFDLSQKTLQVGKEPVRPISDITYALITIDQNNTRLYLGFDEKNKISLWVKNVALSLKPEEINTLRMILPYTSIPEQGDNTVGKMTKKHYVSKATLMETLGN